MGLTSVIIIFVHPHVDFFFSNDPDQPFNLRLQLAAKAGIGLAAGMLANNDTSHYFQYHCLLLDFT